MEYQRVKILLVEDDPDNVWILRSLLGDRWDGPLDLTHVELLSSALDACRRGGFDVLLLDLSLPDSQGLETFLKLSAQAGEIPIVVITGLDDERTAIKAVQAGAGLPHQGPGRRQPADPRAPLRHRAEPPRPRRAGAADDLRGVSHRPGDPAAAVPGGGSAPGRL